MMPKIYPALFLIIITCSFLKCQAQNILNGDFEQASPPSIPGMISNASPWIDVVGSPDLFHQFAGLPVQIPYNWYGVQISQNGQYYAGIVAFDSSGVAGEVMSGLLNGPLIIGETYQFCFDISLAERSKYLTDSIGIALSTSAQFQGNVIGTIQIVDDSIGWERHCISFLADSNYTSLHLGQMGFFPNVINRGCGDLPIAYYYLDNLTLETGIVNNLMDPNPPAKVPRGIRLDNYTRERIRSGGLYIYEGNIIYVK